MQATVKWGRSRVRGVRWPMLLWLGLLLLALVMIYSQAGVVEPNAGHDFILLLSAAQAIRGNLSPYDPFVIVHFASLDGVPLYHLLNGGRATQPYVYPPLFAWLVQPFTHLNTVSALWLWRALSACAIFLGTYGLALTWRKESDLFSTRSRRLMIAALVTLAPLSIYGLYWGNPAALVYAALGVAIWALTRNQARFDVIAGVIMTVLLLKPQLALPLGLLAALCFLQGSDAWQRRRRVFAGFAGATVLLLAADLLVTGPQMLLDWPRSILYLEQFSNGQPDMPSLIGLFWVYLSPLPSALYQGLSLVILGACAITVAVLYMRLRSTWVPAALFGLLTVVWCFGTPYAHANDEILLVPGGFAVLAALSRAWQDGLLRTNVRSRRLITPTQARASWRVVLACVAVALLFFGGSVRYAHYHAHELPYGIAAGIVPLFLLIALGATSRMLMRKGRSAAARRRAARRVTLGAGAPVAGPSLG